MNIILERPDRASCFVHTSGVFFRSNLSGIPGQVRNRKAGSTILVPAVALTNGLVSGFRFDSRNRKRIAVFSRSPRSGWLRRRSGRRSEPVGSASTNCATRPGGTCPALLRTDGYRARCARCGLRSIACPNPPPPLLLRKGPTPGSSGSLHGPPTSLPSNSDAATTV